MKKRSISILLVATIVLCLSVTAVAASGDTIQALLNYGITVKMNNEVQTFKDANGKTVYPISYNGTTYLPVRAVAGLVDLPVEWDGSTNTVYLGLKDRTPLDADDWNTRSSKDHYSVDPTELVVGGKSYTSGFVLSSSFIGYFKPAGKFGSITMTMQADADMTVKFQDAPVWETPTVIKTVQLSANEPQTVTVDFGDLKELHMDVKGKGSLKLVDVYFQ